MRAPHGLRRTRGAFPRGAAVLGWLAVCAVAAALMRVAVAVRRAVDREAEREAELDEWAYSGLS